jgi:hypothetical protein
MTLLMSGLLLATLAVVFLIIAPSAGAAGGCGGG